jgi:large subunit ribosomal protein L11
MPVPVVITAYSDRTFTFITKTPPASWYLKKAAGLGKGSKTPGKGKVGVVTSVQLNEIAQAKIADLNAFDIKAAVKIVHGTARSMGLDIVELPDAKT